jgi:pimeloyl-ACP methyl ester carboxylesterase
MRATGRFTADLRVISIDPLGHGDSSCPADCSLHAPLHRAEDVVAVLDRLDVAAAHLIGYSMGGRIASAVLVHAPDGCARCAGVGIRCAGWLACASAPASTPTSTWCWVGFALLPREVTAWISPERDVALRCCFDAVEDLDGVERALLDGEVPTLLWDGVGDPHHDSSRERAAPLPNAEFFETARDHAAAFYDAGGEAVAGPHRHPNRRPPTTTRRDPTGVRGRLATR